MWKRIPYLSRSSTWKIYGSKQRIYFYRGKKNIMSIWFSADWHLGHTSIIEHCNRPFSNAFEMDQEIISRAKELVKPGNEFYFLGDISMNPAFVSKGLEAMGDRITFIFGNHDKKKIRKLVESSPNVVSAGELKGISPAGKYTVLCHYPLLTWDRKHYGSVHLHGHCHGNLPEEGNRLDVGVDNAYRLLGQYRPFSLGEIFEITAKSLY